MSAYPQDLRQSVIDAVEREDGSAFHKQNPINWLRRPIENWSRRAGNLTVAGMLAMAGWLIFAFLEQPPGGPAMSTEGFVEKCLLTQMEKAYGNAELKRVSEIQKQEAMNEFRRGKLYNTIFHQAKHFELDRSLVKISANDVQEEAAAYLFSNNSDS